MDSMVLASNFVFRRNLYRLGDHRSFVSNFRRLYGISGFLKLLAVELVKNLVPILIGSLLLGIRGHADAGRAFAGFVLVLGRLWPVFYGFRGSHGIFAMVAAAFVAGTSVGAAALVTAVAVVAVTRYVSLGAVAGPVDEPDAGQGAPLCRQPGAGPDAGLFRQRGFTADPRDPDRIQG
jgi:glycerol-3-phosphate acyltransferase PlsY